MQKQNTEGDLTETKVDKQGLGLIVIHRGEEKEGIPYYRKLTTKKINAN